MRLVRVSVPAGQAVDIARTAFSAGIDSVSFQQAEKHKAEGESRTVDIVDIETSTPKAKRFIADLLNSDYYDPESTSFIVRQPRSIGKPADMKDLTVPLEVVPTDLLQELWQFSQVTYGMVIRIFLAAGLLGYGIIHSKILLMIAGLMFLPILPVLMAIGYGVISRTWRLGLQGVAALIVSVALVIAGSAVAALLSDGPIRFDDIASAGTGLVISAVVGVAAGLASIDDVGRRELIGLAAAAQIGIIPAWIGAALVLGVPDTNDSSVMGERALSLVVNSLAIIVTSAAVLLFAGMTRGVPEIVRATNR
jgi:hypothetical protein